MTERAVYSIPVYALRFAAHCRSRLRFTEAAARECVRSDAADASRFWIRFAARDSRAGLAGRCAAHGVRSAS